jgi:hypothetical protein
MFTVLRLAAKEDLFPGCCLAKINEVLIATIPRTIVFVVVVRCADTTAPTARGAGTPVRPIPIGRGCRIPWPKRDGVNKQRAIGSVTFGLRGRNTPRSRIGTWIDSSFAHNKVAKLFIDERGDLRNGPPFAVQPSAGRLMHHQVEWTKRGAFLTNVSAE